MENIDNRKKYIIKANDKHYSTLNKFFVANDIAAKVKFRKIMQKTEIDNQIELIDYNDFKYLITKIKLY